MSDAASQNREQSSRAIAIVVYALLLLALSNGITAIAAVILAAIKRSDAIGTPYESHLGNAIFTFWFVFIAGTLLTIVALELVFGTVLFLSQPVSTQVWHPGVIAILPAIWIGFLLLLIFYLYRTIRGLVRAIERRPYR